MRRAPFNPMFSKQQIIKFEPVIQERLDALFRHLREYATSRKVVPLTLAFTAFSQDIICQFAFARQFNNIESPGFEDTLWDGYQAAAQSSHLALQFPWLLPAMNSLPDWLVLKLQPMLHKLLALQQVGLMPFFRLGIADRLCHISFYRSRLRTLETTRTKTTRMSTILPSSMSSFIAISLLRKSLRHV
jgi:hypothetical protein